MLDSGGSRSEILRCLQGFLIWALEVQKPRRRIVGVAEQFSSCLVFVCEALALVGTAKTEIRERSRLGERKIYLEWAKTEARKWGGVQEAVGSLLRRRSKLGIEMKEQSLLKN